MALARTIFLSRQAAATQSRFSRGNSRNGSSISRCLSRVPPAPRIILSHPRRRPQGPRRAGSDLCSVRRMRSLTSAAEPPASGQQSARDAIRHHPARGRRSVAPASRPGLAFGTNDCWARVLFEKVGKKTVPLRKSLSVSLAGGRAVPRAADGLTSGVPVKSY